METVFCKHFQTGFCKFKEHCRKQHIKEVCPYSQCKSEFCMKRHPRICNYFNTHNTCKFGEDCAYKHKVTNESTNINKLEAKLNTLENTVKAMAEKIEVLEDKLNTKNKESISSPKIQCEHCTYQASSTTVMKRHITTKHIQIDKPEVLRELDSQKPLHLNHPTGERAEKAGTSKEVEEVELKCKYKRCDFISNTNSELKTHIKKKHSIDESFKYPNSTNEVECIECDDYFLEDDNFALHCYYEHLYSYDCEHCHKHLPGESLMHEIHLKMCQAPCGGHPLCPCQF